MYAYLNPFILLYISHKAQHDYSVCRFLFLSFPTHVRGFGGGGASICFYGGCKTTSDILLNASSELVFLLLIEFYH
jgi:hypothetical protein